MTITIPEDTPSLYEAVKDLEYATSSGVTPEEHEDLRSEFSVLLTKKAW